MSITDGHISVELADGSMLHVPEATAIELVTLLMARLPKTMPDRPAALWWNGGVLCQTPGEPSDTPDKTPDLFRESPVKYDSEGAYSA